MTDPELCASIMRYCSCYAQCEIPHSTCVSHESDGNEGEYVVMLSSEFCWPLDAWLRVFDGSNVDVVLVVPISKSFTCSFISRPSHT